MSHDYHAHGHADAGGLCVHEPGFIIASFPKEEVPGSVKAPERKETLHGEFTRLRLSHAPHGALRMHLGHYHYKLLHCRDCSLWFWRAHLFLVPCLAEEQGVVDHTSELQLNKDLQQ